MKPVADPEGPAQRSLQHPTFEKEFPYAER